MSPREVQRLTAALQELRNFHQAGLKSLKDQPRRMGYGSMLSDTPQGRSRMERLRKARAFADPETGYTRAELSELCRNCMEAGFALCLSHVIRLLAVPKARGRRVALQRQTIGGRWSIRRLNAEIRRVQGAKCPPGAGRNLKPPSDPVEALHRIVSLCTQWSSLHEALGVDGEDYFGLAVKSEEIWTKLARLNSGIGRLAQLVEAELRSARKPVPNSGI